MLGEILYLIVSTQLTVLFVEFFRSMVIETVFLDFYTIMIDHDMVLQSLKNNHQYLSQCVVIDLRATSSPCMHFAS